MPIHLPRRSILISVTLLAVLAAEVALESLLRQHELRREQQHTLAMLDSLRARIEALVYRDLYVVRAVAAHIATQPELDQLAFDTYVKALLDSPTALRYVAASRGRVVRYVYPLPGNEALLGTDYRLQPAQGAAMEHSIASHALVVTGPAALAPGGEGFIANEAVFIPTTAGPPAVWGVVSAAIDRDTLYREIGINEFAASFAIAMRAEDSADGSPARVFFGAPEVFTHDVVRSTVNLPSSRWVLGARPQAGWLAAIATSLWMLRAAAVTVAALLIGLVLMRDRDIRRQAQALTALRRSEHAVRRSQQDLINAIEALAEGFALWDQDDRLQVFNQRLIDMLPALADTIHIGMRFEDLIRAMAKLGVVGGDQGQENWLAKRLEQHRTAGGVLEVRTQAGRIATISEYRTADGYVVGLYTDITAMRTAEEHIRYRAYFDALTALPNRENFMNQLSAAIQQSRRDGGLFALLFVDLDHFKNVNDTLGHAVGDRLLIEVALRLKHCLRESDTVARFGGDEFTVILRDIDDAMSAARCAETLIGALTAAFDIDDQTVHSGASIGITLFPADGDDVHDLLRNADLAMYRAKARGRHTYRFFAAKMTTRAEHFVALEKDLRLALGRQEFDFEYQPVVRLTDGTLAGAEALLRWQPPQRGAVAPAEFIAVAEQTRLIVDIGAWALGHACRSAAAWCASADGPLPRLAVNVSGRQLWGGFDGDFVRRILAETGFPAERLVFEITESLLIEEDRRVGAILHDFRELGIGIALDDFGTGYSALGYLRRVPVTMLKIDRTFIGDIETNRSDAHLVAAIIALGRALQLTVVAEGVETATQAQILRDLGCELAQGYFFARPLPAAEFARRYCAASPLPGDPIHHPRADGVN